MITRDPRKRKIAIMFALILFGFAGCTYLMSSDTAWWPEQRHVAVE